jgi:hypothetical protein
MYILLWYNILTILALHWLFLGWFHRNFLKNTFLCRTNYHLAKFRLTGKKLTPSYWTPGSRILFMDGFQFFAKSSKTSGFLFFTVIFNCNQFRPKINEKKKKKFFWTTLYWIVQRFGSWFDKPYRKTSTVTSILPILCTISQDFQFCDCVKV